MTRKTKGLISIMVPVVLWGISFVNTEYLLRSLGPMTIGGIRFTVATLLLYFLMRQSGASLKVDPKDKKLFLVAGLVGISLYFYFENTGIKYISAAPASLIISAIPVLSLIFEALFCKRRIDRIDFFTVVLSIVGVAFIVGLDVEALLSSGKGIGYFMMVGAALSWVVFSLISKPLFDKYSYITIVFYQFFYSLPFFIPFIIFEKNTWSLVGGEALWHLGFLSIFASAVGFYYYAKAMDLLGVTESAVFINFCPIITIMTSYFYFGAMVTKVQFIGGCIVMASVTVTTLRAEKERLPEDTEIAYKVLNDKM